MKVQENLSLGRRNILHMSYQCSVIKGWVVCGLPVGL
jgi:hypothetical protein